jgi:hypothetical protein
VRRYFSGLDLGQAADFTALAVLERTRIEGAPHFALRHLERFPLGTPYTEVCDRLKVAFDRAPLLGTGLAVDATGVGRPVVDLIRKARVKAVLRPVVITAGQQTTSANGFWNVPKKDLVSTLQVLLQSRRLEIAKGLPTAKLLTDELANFKVKVTTNATETFEAWRERDHDDLVLALAVAVWLGEREGGKVGRPFYLGR